MKKFSSLFTLMFAAHLWASGRVHVEIATHTAKSAARQTLAATPFSHMDEMADEMGLLATEDGPFEKDEDNRFLANLKNASDVKIIAPNASHLTARFKDQFTVFLRQPLHSMEVIFANPDSEFYREETEMTSGLKPGDEAYEKNRGLVALSKGLLETYATPAYKNNLHLRYFDTQYRLTMTIIDNKYCYLTVRLSPNEPEQSLRMEFTQGPDPSKGYYNACRRHFDTLWNQSHDEPENGGHWLVALGLGAWTRTELIAFVACFGTFLGGLGGLLGSPIVKRIMRLDQEVAPAGSAGGKQGISSRSNKPEGAEDEGGTV